MKVQFSEYVQLHRGSSYEAIALRLRDLFQIDVSAATVWRDLNGRTRAIPPARLSAYAQVLKVSPQELVSWWMSSDREDLPLRQAIDEDAASRNRLMQKYVRKLEIYSQNPEMEQFVEDAFRSLERLYRKLEGRGNGNESLTIN